MNPRIILNQISVHGFYTSKNEPIVTDIYEMVNVPITIPLWVGVAYWWSTVVLPQP
jgi:hypothetical protein